MAKRTIRPKSNFTKLEELKEIADAWKIATDCAIKLDMSDVTWRIEFASRMFRAIGEAIPDISNRFGIIRLSRPLWLRASSEEKRITVIHEAAHNLADIKYQKNCGHDYEWHETMWRLGIEDSFNHVYHDVSIEGLGQRRYKLICPWCGIVGAITANLRTRWINGQQVRICKKCKSEMSHYNALHALEI